MVAGGSLFLKFLAIPGTRGRKERGKCKRIMKGFDSIPYLLRGCIVVIEFCERRGSDSSVPCGFTHVHGGGTAEHQGRCKRCRARHWVGLRRAGGASTVVAEQAGGGVLDRGGAGGGKGRAQGDAGRGQRRPGGQRWLCRSGARKAGGRRGDAEHVAGGGGRRSWLQRCIGTGSRGVTQGRSAGPRRRGRRAIAALRGRCIAGDRGNRGAQEATQGRATAVLAARGARARRGRAQEERQR
jgi:hypothetical protein